MRTTVAALVAFCAATVAGLLLAGHGLDAALAAVALTLGVIAGIVAWISLRELPPGKPFRGWAAWSMATVFTLFGLRAFCWLIFPKEGNIAFLLPNNLGDLSLHFTFINYFANGAPFWPANPIFASAALHYPFGVDLFNALLTAARLDLQHGLVWVGLLATVATAIALWRWGGAFAMAGFLFNGGLAILAVLHTHRLEELQEPIDWKSIPLALFVTQRGLLYAIPAGLVLLWSWRQRFFRAERGLPFWIEWLLYATMPLFHLHTFLFLSAMLGAWAAASFAGWLRAGAAPGKEILKLGLAAFVPATLLISKLTGGGAAGGMIHLSRGWIGKEMPWLEAVLQNFGVLPLLLLAMLGWFWLRRREPGMEERVATVLPALGVAIIANFVIFAPWEWDNTKLLIWCYLAVLPSLGAFLCEEGGPVVCSIACAALFASGALSLVTGLDGSHQGYTLADQEELDALRPALEEIPVTATFACLPTYNHPLLLLGRKVVAGYEGHLYSHGIDYQPRWKALETLLRGGPGWEEAARMVEADYLFWGPREREKYGKNGDPWRDRLPLVTEGSWGAIYDLSALRR